MDVNVITVTLFFLFLPGLVCALLVSKLTTHRDLKPVDYLIPSFVYGFFVFVSYSWIAAILADTIKFPPYNVLEFARADANRFTSPQSLLIAILIAVVLAFVIAALINSKSLFRLARALRVTRKFGDRDVWSYLMNSPNTHWLTIRDAAVGLYYVGQLEVFSDEEEVRELILYNTHVYDNETGNLLYNAERMYFSFTRDGIIVEVPQAEQQSATEAR